MNSVSRFPFDYDALKKGDTITRDRLEQVTGHSAGSKRYQLKLLSIQDQIERELHGRKKYWTVKISKDEIHILTDADASPYNHALQAQARRSMDKRFALNGSVDLGMLDPDQKQQHERIMEIDGKYVQAFRDTRKLLQIESHKRSTPKMISG